MNGKTGALLLIVALLVLQSCGTDKASRQNQQIANDSSSYLQKTEIKHATGFSIQYYQNYKILNILGSDSKAGDTLQYVLLERGTTKPKGYPNAQVINIPIRSIVAMSSMHIGLLEFLGAENILSGLGNLQYVYSPAILAMIKAGKIAEVGRDQGLNEEKLIEMHPDAVMTVGGTGNKADHYQLLKQAGIPVIANSEWLEKTPLGRAEWVKMIGALLNQEKLVNEKFGEIEAEYGRLAALTKGSANKPSVISGLNTKDAWFLPAGDSYMAQFLKDAGTTYHWANTKSTGSLPINFETVYPIALEADFWVNVGFGKDDTKKSILTQDSRYSDFKAYQSGNMYSYNNRVNELGSNDFFESGTVSPHIVLSDLIRIFHPELLPEHKLVYYKQLR